MADPAQFPVLAVDDDPSVLFTIKKNLEQYTVETCPDPEQALSLLDKVPYDILIVDYRMPKLNGVDFLIKATQKGGYQYRILLTAFADKDILEESINRNLINQVLEKPASARALQDSVARAVTACAAEREKAEQVARLRAGYQALREDLNQQQHIIGLDGGLQQVAEQMRKAAAHPVHVLLCGETGTGKELVARAIHDLSERREAPFVKINCAAIPDQLMESELFGHARGAFTDAKQDRVGKLELAAGGTLFLDEIGEMKIDLQAKLLHVLQEKTVVRLGSNTTIATDFRLICATNRDLEQAVAEKSFREDLYYRINTFPITLPPLRRRQADLPPLVDYFITVASREMHIPPARPDTGALELLRAYPWPGNIRELENAVKRAVISASGEPTLSAAHFSFLRSKRSGGDYDQALDCIIDTLLEEKLSLQDIEATLLKRIVERFDNNIALASRKTGISRNRFFRRKAQDGS